MLKGTITRLVHGMIFLTGLLVLSAQATEEGEPIFKGVPTQFIAALGDPEATSGTGAETWGLWETDPGPRGVWLSLYPVLSAAGGYAPAGWSFDSEDWWLDENGLIMEKPKFSLSPGKYIVTGNRQTTAILTVHPDENGTRRWELNKGANLHDVTHLGCRSARYTPKISGGECSPSRAPRSAFKIAPGTSMPSVEGCNKQDYSVLFVVAVAEDN